MDVITLTQCDKPTMDFQYRGKHQKYVTLIGELTRCFTRREVVDTYRRDGGLDSEGRRIEEHVDVLGDVPYAEITFLGKVKGTRASYRWPKSLRGFKGDRIAVLVPEWSNHLGYNEEIMIYNFASDRAVDRIKDSMFEFSHFLFIAPSIGAAVFGLLWWLTGWSVEVNKWIAIGVALLIWFFMFRMQIADWGERAEQPDARGAAFAHLRKLRKWYIANGYRLEGLG